MQELWEGKSDDYPLLSPGGYLEFNIKKKVYCDIAQAIQDNNRILPEKWGVQVTLDLQVDETGAVNPGGMAVVPLNTAENVNVGAGATLSSVATREDKFGSYWELARLRGQPSCGAAPGSSLLIESDLGVSPWLKDALLATYVLPSSKLGKDNEFKQDYLSYHVRFVVKTAGNVNPTWKLVRFASYGSAPLASADRTRTHDLLVTFGPMFKKQGLNLAQQSHAAQELGIAVSNGTRVLNAIPGFPY